MTEYIFSGNSKEKKLGLVKFALDQKLYVKGWMLKETLEKILEKSASNFFICMAVQDDIPVGVAICLNYGAICFYVKPKYRRQGIGTKMYEIIQIAIADKYGQGKLYGEIGTRESELFFANLKIPVYS